MKSKKELKAFIKDCQFLEKEMSGYKLHGNLIPKKNYGKNLRSTHKSQWEKIRKAVYKKANNTCAICGAHHKSMHAHEHWGFDYKKRQQQLKDLICVCELCHNNIHLGKTFALAKERKVNIKTVKEHWAKVNKCELEEFNYYAKKVGKLWEFRNQIEWEVIYNIELVQILCEIYKKLKSRH